MSLSQAADKAILDHILKTAAYSQPANIYVALYTAAPTGAGGGTEVSGNNYARTLCNSWAAATNAAPSVASNSAAVNFPTPSATWGTIVAFGLFDAVTGGNFLGWGTVSPSVVTYTSVPVSAAIGALTVSLQ